MLEPKQRNIVVHVAGEPVTREVSFTGRPVDVKL
jgi:hypothetical protein